VLSIVVSRWVAPGLVDRSGLRMAGVTGRLLVATGFALLLRLGPGTGYATGLLPAVVVCFGLGMGIAYPVFTIAAVSGVDAAEQGVAAGVQSTALQVGGGLGLALVSGAVAVGLGPDQGRPIVDRPNRPPREPDRRVDQRPEHHSGRCGEPGVRRHHAAALDGQLGGGAREVQLLRDRDEVPQMAELGCHGAILRVERVGPGDTRHLHHSARPGRRAEDRVQPPFSGALTRLPQPSFWAVRTCSTASTNAVDATGSGFAGKRCTSRSRRSAVAA
jgi:hypothetical protein